MGSLQCSVKFDIDTLRGGGLNQNSLVCGPERKGGGLEHATQLQWLAMHVGRGEGRAEGYDKWAKGDRGKEGWQLLNFGVQGTPTQEHLNGSDQGCAQVKHGCRAWG